MKHEIQQLIAFCILIFGIAALIILTAAMINQLMHPCTYLLAMMVAVLALYLDSKWIDKHFVGGEWI